MNHKGKYRFFVWIYHYFMICFSNIQHAFLRCRTLKQKASIGMGGFLECQNFPYLKQCVANHSLQNVPRCRSISEKRIAQNTFSLKASHMGNKAFHMAKTARALLHRLFLHLSFLSFHCYDPRIHGNQLHGPITQSIPRRIQKSSYPARRRY